MHRVRGTPRGWNMLWIVAMLAVTALGVRPAYAASASVDNPVVETGSTLVVRVSGFRNNEALVTWVSSARGSVYPAEPSSVDNQGNVTINISIKSFWEPGYWAVTVHGVDSEREAVAQFEVKTGPPDGRLELSATTLAPGTTLQARGEGFKSGELVSAWITRPDGTADQVPASPLEPIGGRIQFSYAIPAGAPLGVWAVTAYGNGSDVILVSQFTVAR